MQGRDEYWTPHCTYAAGETPIKERDNKPKSTPSNIEGHASNYTRTPEPGMRGNSNDGCKRGLGERCRGGIS